MTNKKDDAPLNQTPCPKCGKDVDDRAPACPYCGEKIYINVPGDTTPTKHPPVSFPSDEQDAEV